MGLKDTVEWSAPVSTSQAAAPEELQMHPGLLLLLLINYQSNYLPLND